MSKRRLKNGKIVFSDYPEFRPNLTPKEIFQSGSFGGTYFRPIYSSITKKNYKNKHKEFPKSWFAGLDIDKYVTSSECDKSINKYKVKSGTSLRYWEKKKWIKHQDPYGWIQWYCRFYQGRRSKDDERQIKRWLGIAGPNGRFRKRLYNLIKNKKTRVNDTSVSPVIRQLLLQWAYHPNGKDK